MSEYNILNTLHQMTMVSNVYKTQSQTSDHVIANLLVVGFSGQLKGWWDNYLTTYEQNKILKAVKKDKDNQPILDEQNTEIQDAVAFLIFSISKHFIGDPSHLKDKNSELLSNLKCKKRTDFKWYKDTFMTRIMQRTDNNQPFWKEKFLARLSILLGEKVRNQIRETYKGIIPYENLTYGKIISFTQKEGLKICQDMKLQKPLKREDRKSTRLNSSHFQVSRMPSSA